MVAGSATGGAKDGAIAAGPRQVKLSCRNVWKVYGPRPGYYFDAAGYKIEPLPLAKRMRAEGHIPAAVDVSFDLHVGEIFVIMGLSGSGKSTVVRCLSRLVEPTYGEILLDGQNLLKASPRELIDIRRHKMGMVFQSFGLLPHLNVIDNIAFPLKLQGLSLAERRQRAERVIDLVGLKGREKHFPSQLSGGQQQRVGIARSLAVEPELWFLDEPFSALDPLIRRQMQDEFLRIQQVLKKSIVFITHDFLEALRIADRMAIMRDGAIVQIGTPAELIMNPADDYVREFTSDVPIARVLRAETVASRAAAATAGNLERVAADTSVEMLLPRLASNPDGLAVVGANGAVIGVATARSVVDALAREARARESEGGPT
ncbi:MAG: betaine/proline/choline family ABC transporter ATP-binding protein [Hyphomicrobiaceae bacterium]